MIKNHFGNIIEAVVKKHKDSVPGLYGKFEELKGRNF